jgi:pimeloyl-ACP methyl ester carboxylesterase
MSRMLYLALLSAVVLVVAGWATRPARLEPPRAKASVTDNPAALLAEQEAAVDAALGIIGGAEKRIVWASEPGVRSELVIIYLHGFSATRQEIAPVPEQVAAALGANLFETRLAGHGLEAGPLTDVSAEAWLEDGAEALAVGRALGERLVLMGTSTGATLALALAGHPDFAAVDALVMLSPNFGPAAAGSGLATGPFGPQLVRLLTGEYREWVPANERQGRYWSTRYPNTSLVEMMRLVDLAQRQTEAAQVSRAMLIYSPQDQVVSVERLRDGFARLPAAEKQVLEIEKGGGPSNHVLAGDILAPENNALTSERIVAFLSND